MREIKYRAYIKSLKLMRPVERINFDVKTVELHIEDSEEYHNDLYEYDFDELVLMQYTGLQDQYGNDLYEGDIIFEEDREYIGIIKFDEGGFIVEYEGVCCRLWEVQDEFQLIGNIFENKELLE